jgi:hypothetical protein
LRRSGDYFSVCSFLRGDVLVDISDDRGTGRGRLCLKGNANDVVDGPIPNQRPTIILLFVSYDSLFLYFILPCCLPLSPDFGAAAKHVECKNIFDEESVKVSPSEVDRNGSSASVKLRDTLDAQPRLSRAWSCAIRPGLGGTLGQPPGASCTSVFYGGRPGLSATSRGIVHEHFPGPRPL